MVFAALLIFVVNVAKAQNNVPVYMWNIDTDAVSNPFQALNSEELVNQLASSLNGHQLIAIFMQDDLSIEDFKSDSLSALKSVAETDNEGTFYHPSLSNPENLPKLFANIGYNTIKVKSHEDLPTTSVKERTVLVIQLPVTLAGDFRSENLQLNGDAVANVFEVLKSQQSNVVGIFTATKNSKAVVTTHKVKRDAPASPKFKNTDIFINGSNLFLFLENPPVLTLKSVDRSIDFTLDQIPEYSESNDTRLVLKYKDISGTDDKNMEGTLNSATMTFTFERKGTGYWDITGSSIEYEASIGGQTVSKPTTSLNPTSVASPFGFSYHCTPKLTLARETEGTVTLQMDGFQLEPFKKAGANSFGDWYDCQGFFTEGIWAIIVVGLFLAAILAWAISMLADVKSPDRFDNPKGKTITVSATD